MDIYDIGSSDPALSSVLTCFVLLCPVLLYRLCYLGGGGWFFGGFPYARDQGWAFELLGSALRFLVAGSAAAHGLLHRCLSPGVCSEAPCPCSVPGSDLLKTLSTSSSDSELENVVMPSPLLLGNPRTFTGLWQLRWRQNLGNCCMLGWQSRLPIWCELLSFEFLE